MSININQRLNGLNPLAYLGDNAVQPPDFNIKPRPPTVNDSKNFFIGDMWLDNTGYPGVIPKAENVWMLVALVGNQATWVHFGAGGIETLTGNSGGPVFSDVNDNINIIGDGITIDVAGNPGTNTLTISAVDTGLISSLTGNSGGAVFPTAGNIDILGTGVITVVGNPGTSTLTVTPSGDIASSFPTNAGTATPAAGVLNVLGGTAGRDINTSGAGSTINIDLNNAITLGDLSAIGAGSNALEAVTGDIKITAGNLKLPFGSTTATEGALATNSGTKFFHGYGSGGGNLFIGGNAGNVTLTTAALNVCLGTGSLNDLTTGGNNSALGDHALSLLTSGQGNTALGYLTLPTLLTGSVNTAIGKDAGNAYTGAESNNILIQNTGVIGESNVIRIGTSGGGAGQQNKCWIAGIRGITTDVNDAIAVLIDSTGQLGTVSSSARYKDNINDMGSSSDVLSQLRPVVFNYKDHSPESVNFGLIAEEVEQIAPRLVVYGKDGLVETVRYDQLVPMLLNELQKTNKIVADLQARISVLESR